MTDYVPVWEYAYQYLWLASLLIFVLMGLLLEAMFREPSGFVEPDLCPDRCPVSRDSLPAGEKT